MNKATAVHDRDYQTETKVLLYLLRHKKRTSTVQITIEDAEKLSALDELS